MKLGLITASRARRLSAAAAGPGLVPAVSWSAVQSSLAPHGPNAAEITGLAWILFSGGAAILVLVIAITAYVVLAAHSRPSWLGSHVLVISGGIVFPVTVLAALLPYTLIVSNRVSLPCAEDALRIEVTGAMWWWRVAYVDAEDRPLLVTANEIHVPAHRPVRVALTTTDVIHGFWVPGLSGMLDVIPGRTNTLCFVAGKPGVLRGQCAEFCGTQHARMAFDVRVHAPEDFEAWLAKQMQPAVEPGDERLRHGQRMFMQHCGSCHTVRGTEAAGSLGPDLTHVGSRTTLAAGTLPNNAGTIAAWIVSGQHLKPGNRMPEFDDFPGAELAALAAYVASLR